LYSCSELHADAQKAFRQYWFIQSIQIGQETYHTLSLRLHIRTDLFVLAFVGEISGSLYLALIERERRIFDVDYDSMYIQFTYPREYARELAQAILPFVRSILFLTAVFLYIKSLRHEQVF
jgi:hypothetical protein